MSKNNPLLEAKEKGQSIWYDNIRRALIQSGELLLMVRDDGLAGVTSNPAIFQKAISGSQDYDASLRELVLDKSGDAKQIYEKLAIEDIQMAADVLGVVHEDTRGRDGYVSLEVSPYLANDTEATIEEAKRLHTAVRRENVMIKVPATQAGIPAIRELTRIGIPINVTLLFSLQMYHEAHQAYLEGLEARLEDGGDLNQAASVASFFLSRIDSKVDQLICEQLDGSRNRSLRGKLKSVLGHVAIANAHVAYGQFRASLDSDRWRKLEAQGARPQRLLWASTSTKSPKYADTLYVDSLIAPHTVNTLPVSTYNAFRDHGNAKTSFIDDWETTHRRAQEVLETLGSTGISLDSVTDELLDEGVQKFADAFDTLLREVEKKRRDLLACNVTKQTAHLGRFAQGVEQRLEEWRRKGLIRQLWRKDASLWTNQGEAEWLGWLDLVEGQRDHLDQICAVAEEVRSAGFEHVLLLGMGGSSLCPEVLSLTLGPIEGWPRLHVLDSTVPAQVQQRSNQINISKTLFVVASKSGGTTEPNAFKQYFFDQVAGEFGSEEAGRRFVAITDPGTKLHKLAKAERFRHILHGVPSVGGRYSALSNFGLLPAALMGIDVDDFLDRTEIMEQACAAAVPPRANPGVELGISIGVLAQQGCDKLTIVASPGLSSLGAWLEQLVAESLGKNGLGVVPVDGERLDEPKRYGSDRFFVYLRLRDSADETQDGGFEKLLAAGHPGLRIEVNEARDIGQEFFRWEMATAVAGSILGLNPFDQPDVEASKLATRQLTAEFEKSGELPDEDFLLSDSGIGLSTDDGNVKRLSLDTQAGMVAALRSLLDSVGENDYFAINAYLPMDAEHESILQELRHLVRDRRQVATTLGFGPRFLHSTGQLHKGGPNNGVFLQLTSDDANDLAVPGQLWTFAHIKRFQAQGDYEVLVERERRLLRLHLPADTLAALQHLKAWFEEIL